MDKQESLKSRKEWFYGPGSFQQKLKMALLENGTLIKILKRFGGHMFAFPNNCCLLRSASKALRGNRTRLDPTLLNFSIQLFKLNDRLFIRTENWLFQLRTVANDRPEENTGWSVRLRIEYLSGNPSKR